MEESLISNREGSRHTDSRSADRSPRVRMGFEQKCVFAILLFRGSQAVSSPARRVIDLLGYGVVNGNELISLCFSFEGSQV